MSINFTSSDEPEVILITENTSKYREPLSTKPLIFTCRRKQTVGILNVMNSEKTLTNYYDTLMGHEHTDDDEGGTKTLTRPKTQFKKPPMYKVLLLNDDYTPMDFVTHVLVKFFKKNNSEANSIMLSVHQTGAGLCGVFSFEIAETKVFQVNSFAKESKYPLKCTLEEE